jgi:hypothetical protein
MDHEAKLTELRQQRDECIRTCQLVSKEIADLEDFVRTETIKGITLEPGSVLIDLLRLRILDPSPDWKSNIDTLINIPTTVKGEGVLNGGDYFEALFQLAIAVGVLPQFRDYGVVFHDVTRYKDLTGYPNYLYEKSINNKGGGEQGISDITFELVTHGGVPAHVRVPRSCGQLTHEPTEAGQSNAAASPKTPRTMYFISVKNFLREKSIKDGYDIPLLTQQLQEFPEIANKHVVVCVRNRLEFLKRLGRSRIEFLKTSIDHVIGYDDLVDAFSSFRTNFFLKLASVDSKTIEEEIAIRFPKKELYKPALSLYFHQELVARSAIERIKVNPTPSNPFFLCVGVLPRGGKSFIAGGIMDMHRKLLAKESYNVLFLTSAVNETRDQFKEDLIDKFSEFKDFTFVDVVTTKKKIDPGKNNFVFVSRQLSSLSKEKEGTETSIVSETDLVSRLKRVFKTDVSFDLCFFDEAHIGIVSETVRTQFQKTFETFKMPIVLMSATYKKPAMVLENPEDLFVWDLRDIKDMKDLPAVKLSGFVEKQPDVLQRYPIAQSLLEQRVQLGQSEAEIAKPYLQFPSPNFISLTFTPETVQHLKDTGNGYDYMKAFQINSNPELLNDSDKYTEWGSLLANPEDALRIRQFLTPEQDTDDKFLVSADRKYRAFNQIFAIAQRTGSRPMIGKPFSVLMFLPFGVGLPIGELCRIWGSFLLQSRYWRDNFVVMTLSRYAGHVKSPKMTIAAGVKRGLCHRDDFSDDISLKSLILQVEEEALKVGKGLVLLSGDVAKMGISLKCVDIVCLMSNNKDADDIIQKMYRALTDDPPTKKNGFIIDLDLKRIITAMFEYDMEKSRRTASKKTVTPQERIHQLMELCNWGQDAYIIEHPEKSFDDVMNDIRRMVFEGVESRIRLEYGSRELVDRQFKVIQDNPKLLKNVMSVLQYTTGKRAKTAAVELMQAGPDIPGPESKEDETVPKEPVEKQEPEVEPLTLEQIKKKIIDIMITFVNALVIKSDQPWKDMNFKTLIDKYNADKQESRAKRLIPGDFGDEEEFASAVCSCNSTQECGKTFSNLYDTAFCELRTYAMLESTKQVRTKEKRGKKPEDEETQLQRTTVYNKPTHDLIMELMDTIFAESSELAPDWTNYIHSLIGEITNRKKVGGQRKTKRNKTKDIDNNVRTTQRNHSRNN